MGILCCDFAAVYQELLLDYLDTKLERRNWKLWSAFAEDLAIIRLTGGFVEY